MSFEGLALVISQNAILGSDESQLRDFMDTKVHFTAVSALNQFKVDAHSAGFCLGLASAYRGFERQLSIWNRKAQGVRPILDGAGLALNRADLSDDEALFAILRWSALPGTSRHHWGTDFDVVDLSAVQEGYQIQLTVDETCGQGIFAPFHAWLSEYLPSSRLGFFRPYSIDVGGIACEPWHLSYAPTAHYFQAALGKDFILERLKNTDIQLKHSIVKHFDEIFARFIWVDWSVYPENYQSNNNR